MSAFDQAALDRASWELQRHFGREGSIYGIKACEEIARIALTAYGALPEEGWRKISDIGPMPNPHVIRGPGLLSVYMEHSGEWFRYDLPTHLPQDGGVSK